MQNKRKLIYLLEDNDDIRDVVSMIFDGEEYNLQEFETVKALRLGLNQAVPDLFILDVMLPDGNGMDICSELKSDKKFEGVPVILMSANFALGGKAGMCQPEDFINKPFDINDFKNRVDQQLGF